MAPLASDALTPFPNHVSSTIPIMAAPYSRAVKLPAAPSDAPNRPSREAGATRR